MSRTIRIIFILCIVGLAFIAACTSQKGTSDKTIRSIGPDELAHQSGKVPEGEVAKTPPVQSQTPKSSNPEIAKAQDLLAKNDSKGAIRTLENLAKTQRPLSDELKNALIEAHDSYLTQLSIMRNIPKEQMDIFIEVMYMHAARILDLKPDHATALAQKQSVMTYFKEHKKTPPAVIDPLMFLDERLSQAGGQPNAAGPSEPKGAGK